MHRKRNIVILFVLLFGGVIWLLLSVMKPVQAPVQQQPINNGLEPDKEGAAVTVPTQTSDIIVTTPTQKQSVTSPITITGKAKGNWFFEASFPVTLTNWDGLIISEGHATALGNFQTSDYVPFTATLSYTLPKDTPYKRGFLILKNDNPSGDPARDKSIELEVELN